jgi:hypothetical protein
VTPKGEKTEVVYGPSNVLDREIQFFSNSKLKIDTCMDYTLTSLALGIEPIRKSFLDAKNRDIKLRYITEITTENISYCKELMKITELRHLDGFQGNFMMRMNTLHEQPHNKRQISHHKLFIAMSGKSYSISIASLIVYGIRQYQ